MSPGTGILALIVACFIAFSNWQVFYQSVRKRKFIKTGIMPLAAGMLFFYGFAQFEETFPYAMWGLALDYGTLILPIYIPVWAKFIFDLWVTYWWNICALNVLRKLEGNANNLQYTIKLCKRGICSITAEQLKENNDNDWTAFLDIIGNWQEKDKVIILDGHYDGVTVKLIPSDEGYIAEEHYSDGEKLECIGSLDGIEFKYIKS